MTVGAPAYEMKGPSALSGDRRRFVNLTRLLAVTEFKLRFFDSILGYLWTLMRPLLLFGVLFVVFSEVLKVGDGVPYYPVILLSGMVLFFFFNEATSKAVTSALDNEVLVRKIHFPRLAIPLSVVLTASFNLGLNLIVLIFFMLVSGVYPMWSWLELPLIVALILVLTVGVSMLLSALYVTARDVLPIWEVLLQIVFYATPILYPITLLADRNETLSHVAMASPLAALITELRHAMVGGKAPSAAAAIGGAPRLLVPLGILVGVFVLGLWVFNRMAPRIAEEL